MCKQSAAVKPFKKTNKVCAWQHNNASAPARWQCLRIYSPGGGAVPACWLFKTSATSWPL